MQESLRELLLLSELKNLQGLLRGVCTFPQKCVVSIEEGYPTPGVSRFLRAAVLTIGKTS